MFFLLLLILLMNPKMYISGSLLKLTQEKVLRGSKEGERPNYPYAICTSFGFTGTVRIKKVNYILSVQATA